jgi:L-aspartate oxidase
MWNYVGILRSNQRLERAAKRISLLQDEIQSYYWNVLPSSDLIELRNIATVAELIIACASLRRESRGLHTTIDYPEARPSEQHETVIQRATTRAPVPLPPGSWRTP